jgi:hypothetical protein
VQDEYVQLQHIDNIVDTEWMTLLATKLEEPSVTIAQDFVAGLRSYQGNGRIMWTTMTVSTSRPLPLYQSWALRLKETTKKSGRLTRDESKIVVGACWALRFGGRLVLWKYHSFAEKHSRAAKG